MRAALMGTAMAAVLAATAGVWTVLGAQAAPAPAANAVSELPSRVDDFQLVDQYRYAHQLSYYKYASAIVLMTQKNGSATSAAAAPALQQIADAYKDKGVVVFMVNSNLSDSRESLAVEAKKLGVKLPILSDEHQLVGEQLGATRDGEVFVLSPKDLKIAYHGPVDDRFLKAKFNASAKPTQPYLTQALDAVIAGKTVATANVEAPGAAIAFPERERRAQFAKISYANTVAPIIQDRCVTCHQKGGIGPFAMTSYEIVRGYAPMIRETLRTNRMPPYFADAHIGHFKNDAGLTLEQRKTLVHWIEAGAPRGDGGDPLAEHVTEAPEWPAKLGKPDYIVSIPGYDIPASGVLEYKNPIVQNPFKEDKWLRAIAIKPGDRTVLHHVTSNHVPDRTIKSDLPGGSVGSYTPGAEPQVIADEAGAPIPAGGAFHFSMHYTTTGKATHDETKVGFYFRDTPPKYIKRASVIGNFAMAIPANDPKHEEIAYMTLPADIILYTIYPHAHYRGSRAEFSVIYPNGKEETLLSLPKYDFNWQRDYDLKEPMRLPAGAKLVARWTYDNSAHNKANPDSSINVTWGEQSFQEMMYLRVNYRWADEDKDHIRNDLQKQFEATRTFGSLDVNLDGKIEESELRGPMAGLKARFKELDKNHDGFLDAEEFSAVGGFGRGRPAAKDNPDL